MFANILHNYSAQVFLALAGLITLPFLLDIMGPELYAFVAILFTVQSVFSILDGGLSGTLAREFALKRSSHNNSLSAKSLINKTEPVFYVIATTGFLLIYISSYFISNSWLNITSFDRKEAQHYIIIIGLIASIRMAGALYRSVLIGYEKHKNLSYINIASTLVRYLLILPILYHFGADGHIYFYYQLGAALVEIAVLKFYAILIIPNSTSLEYAKAKRSGRSELLSLLRESVKIWILTIIWVVSTQIDKVFLSGKLSLEDFAYFSIVSTLALALLMLGSPITSAAMPRISIAYIESAYQECEHLYFEVSRLLTLIAFPIFLTLLASPEHVLFLMTNKNQAATQYSFILACYSIGSVFLLLSGLTFLLQYSAGNLVTNIRCNLIYVVMLVFAMAVATHIMAAEGAALAWLLINALLIMFIIRPLNSLSKVNFHSRWLITVIVKPLLFSVPLLALSIYFSPPIVSRLESLVCLLITYGGLALNLVACFYFKLNNKRIW